MTHVAAVYFHVRRPGPGPDVRRRTYEVACESCGKLGEFSTRAEAQEAADNHMRRLG